MLPNFPSSVRVSSPTVVGTTAAVTQGQLSSGALAKAGAQPQTGDKALGPPAEAPQQVSAPLGATLAPVFAQGLLNPSSFYREWGDMETCRAPSFPPHFCSRLGRTGALSFPRSAHFSVLTVKGPLTKRVG